MKREEEIGNEDTKLKISNYYVILTPLDVYILSRKSIKKRHCTIWKKTYNSASKSSKSIRMNPKWKAAIYREQSVIKLFSISLVSKYETIAMKRVALCHLNKRPSLNSISERTL